MSEEALRRLIEMIKNLEEDNREFYSGNNEAGTRLRNRLREVKRQAEEMRNEIRLSYKANA